MLLTEGAKLQQSKDIDANQNKSVHTRDCVREGVQGKQLKDIIFPSWDDLLQLIACSYWVALCSKHHDTIVPLVQHWHVAPVVFPTPKPTTGRCWKALGQRLKH